MWLDLQIFGFRALWSPYFFTYILLLALAYFLITGPLRHKFGGQEKPSIKQMTFFYSGLILLYIVKGSPIDLLSHIKIGRASCRERVKIADDTISLEKRIKAGDGRKAIARERAE